MQPWGKTVVSPAAPPMQMQAVASGRKEPIGHTRGQVPGAVGPLLCSGRDAASRQSRGSDFYVVAFAQVRCHPPWPRGSRGRQEPGLLSVCPRRLPGRQTLGVGEGLGDPQRGRSGQTRMGLSSQAGLSCPWGPGPPLATSTDQSRGAAVPGGGDPSPGAGRG